MRYISEIIFLLATTTATLTGEKIDTSVLVPCKNSEGCHPWQVCATCTTPILWGFMGAHLTKGWCSDVSDTGICDYDDGDLSCSCNKNEENDPKRRALLKLDSVVPELVYCKHDSDCRQLQPNARCSHCSYATEHLELVVILNACTAAPKDDPGSYCDNSKLFMCSCGQRLPAPVEQPQQAFPQTKHYQQNVVTAANPPDLTGAETVDLSAWGTQAVLGGGVGGSLPLAEDVAFSSTQDTGGPTSGEENIWDLGWI